MIQSGNFGGAFDAVERTVTRLVQTAAPDSMMHGCGCRFAVETERAAS